MKYIISKTGEIHGKGSDPYKWVSRLTKEERSFVKSGGLVLIEVLGKRKPNQTKYKKVIYESGRFNHRNYGDKLPK